MFSTKSIEALDKTSLYRDLISFVLFLKGIGLCCKRECWYTRPKSLTPAVALQRFGKDRSMQKASVRANGSGWGLCRARKSQSSLIETPNSLASTHFRYRITAPISNAAPVKKEIDCIWNIVSPLCFAEGASAQAS
jgi:hypothetical protein